MGVVAPGEKKKKKIYGLKVFTKWAMRKTFGSKREEVAEYWRKLHNNELHDLHCSRNVIQIDPRRIRLTAWSRVLLLRDYVSSDSQEISHIVWKRKVHYRVHNSLAPVPVLT